MAATSSEVRTVATRVVAEAEPDQHQARHRRAYATRALTQHPDDGDGMGPTCCSDVPPR